MLIYQKDIKAHLVLDVFSRNRGILITQQIYFSSFSGHYVKIKKKSL